MTEGWRRDCYNVAAVRARARRICRGRCSISSMAAPRTNGRCGATESAFDEFALLPRPLNGPGERDMSVELFGRRLAMPVAIGPTGLAGLMWPQGEMAAARAAAAAGTAYCPAMVR